MQVLSRNCKPHLLASGQGCQEVNSLYACHGMEAEQLWVSVLGPWHWTSVMLHDLVLCCTPMPGPQETEQGCLEFHTGHGAEAEQFWVSLSDPWHFTSVLLQVSVNIIKRVLQTKQMVNMFCQVSKWKPFFWYHLTAFHPNRKP